MFWLRKRTLPSPNAALQPLAWLLPMLTSLKVLLETYVWMFMAAATFFEQVPSLFQAKPRCQARKEPASSSLNEDSNTISVLLLPSAMSGIVMAEGGGGVVVYVFTTYGRNGRMPSV